MSAKTEFYQTKPMSPVGALTRYSNHSVDVFNHLAADSLQMQPRPPGSDQYLVVSNGKPADACRVVANPLFPRP
jgi:hypothetical protein